MSEADKLAAAAQALTAAAKTYAGAAGETMELTGSAVALGHELSTSWKGRASGSFMGSLDRFSGDSFNLMNAFNEASSIMNGLALAIEANLGPLRKAEALQQQTEGSTTITPEVARQLTQAQNAADTALSTITYLANSAAGSLEALNTVGVCSTGLGVFNLDIQTPSKDGKTTIMVNGKPLLVIDDATGDILENNTGGSGAGGSGAGGSGAGGSGGGGGGGGNNGGSGGSDQPWWHEWWGKDASLWKRLAIRAAIGYSVSAIGNGSSTLFQGKPWSWESWAIQGTVLSAAYEVSVLGGIKGPVDKIFSSIITATYGSVAYQLGIGGGKKKPAPTPGLTPAPTLTTPKPTKTTSPTPAPSPSPSPSPTPTTSLIH